jgi:hypothetical protein
MSIDSGVVGMDRWSEVDRAETIKWWDALDGLVGQTVGLKKGLQLARECRHPDAAWVAALFPPGIKVTPERFVEVLQQQGDDPRAMYIVAARSRCGRSGPLMRRAAEMGYAPAQAVMASAVAVPETPVWAQRAASQHDREGVCMMANCLLYGWGCDADKAGAAELFRAAAELGHAAASYEHAVRSFDESDWRYYMWWSRAAAKGYNDLAFRSVMAPILEGKYNARIVHSVAPVIRAHLNVRCRTLFGEALYYEGELDSWVRLLAQQDAMMQRARQAIDCWSVVARRCGVAKDIRLLIAKMAWEDAWRWGEKEATDSL